MSKNNSTKAASSAETSKKNAASTTDTEAAGLDLSKLSLKEDPRSASAEKMANKFEDAKSIVPGAVGQKSEIKPSLSSTSLDDEIGTELDGLLRDLHDKFEFMSSAILSQIDQLGDRVLELEGALEKLMDNSDDEFEEENDSIQDQDDNEAKLNSGVAGEHTNDGSAGEKAEKKSQNYENATANDEALAKKKSKNANSESKEKKIYNPEKSSHGAAEEIGLTSFKEKADATANNDSRFSMANEI